MKHEIYSVLKKLIKDQRGVTLVEYGIALALALGVGTLALTLLGGEISAGLTTVGTQMPN